MATIIGLSIRVKLLRSLPPRFKVDVTIAPGTHASEAAVNKQLADKVKRVKIINLQIFLVKEILRRKNIREVLQTFQDV